jgi:acid stress chaperone HdeB
MKFAATVLTTAMLGFWVPAVPAVAEEIDLSTWTCKQFQSATKEEVGIILSWLDGYYKEEDDPAVIDTDSFVENAKKLGTYCSSHPDSGLITATDKLFKQQK